MQRQQILASGQNRRALTIARDTHHLVERRAEFVRAGRKHRHGNEPGAGAGNERADHFEARRIGEQHPVAGSEATIALEVAGDQVDPAQERLVGVRLQLSSVQIDEGVETLVRVLRCDLFQSRQERGHPVGRQRTTVTTTFPMPRGFARTKDNRP